VKLDIKLNVISQTNYAPDVKMDMKLNVIPQTNYAPDVKLDVKLNVKLNVQVMKALNTWSNCKASSWAKLR
jgi:hypothetical protein